MGRGVAFWVGFVIVVAVLASFPEYMRRYDIINLSNFLISGFLALSLSLIWGYCGVLSLGQAAFHGIGGYAYGIVALNLFNAHGNTDLAFFAGILVPVVFAAIIGGIMFFARLRGVYIAILMLVVSLLIGTFMRQTADPSYTIGAGLPRRDERPQARFRRRPAASQPDLRSRRDGGRAGRSPSCLLLLRSRAIGGGLSGPPLPRELQLRLLVGGLPGGPEQDGNLRLRRAPDPARRLLHSGCGRGALGRALHGVGNLYPPGWLRGSHPTSWW